MDGLLTQLLGTLLQKHEADRCGIDAQVFEPACVATWESQVAGMDDMGDAAEAVGLACAQKPLDTAITGA